MKTLFILLIVGVLAWVIKPKVTVVKMSSVRDNSLLFSEIYKINEQQRQKAKNLQVRSF